MLDIRLLTYFSNSSKMSYCLENTVNKGFYERKYLFRVDYLKKNLMNFHFICKD